MDEDRLLTIAAFIKWVRGEPLAKEDVERILHVMQFNELKISLTDPAILAGLQVRIRQILNERFGGPPTQ